MSDCLSEDVASVPSLLLSVRSLGQLSAFATSSNSLSARPRPPVIVKSCAEVGEKSHRAAPEIAPSRGNPGIVGQGFSCRISMGLDRGEEDIVLEIPTLQNSRHGEFRNILSA